MPYIKLLSFEKQLPLINKIIKTHCPEQHYDLINYGVSLQPDSEVAEAGRCLEIFFESKLKEIYPEKQFPLVQQDDSDLEDVENENSQASPKELQWPSYRQECIQPKRRRRHAVRI